ncbi:glycosyltransferase family 1 protein [Modestobacter sp. KNN46-3]|jgi:glycosyltransferase involved in cell wall biosynthesis|uniref:glycosyltransferase family 4 protein n=1 Tax=Modestobacter sp. KNN46-3 TaxID=2711218 RepID=UPI0013E0779D|nr:glycosyltransferase family 1 protein [Modestobacter sp. KNN46-3]
MKIALDATPLLGRSTGVGTYVRGLTSGLAELPGLDLRAVPFTLRGGRRPAELPPAVQWRHLPVPARALQAAWTRAPLPPVEAFSGRVDVFHATNFVAPPALRTASVVTVHDLTYLRFPEWVTDAVLRYRDLVPRALDRPGTVVVTPTRAVADEVTAAYSLPEDRVVVTPLGVDPAWSGAHPVDDAWLAARGLPDEFLLFVGAREPRKNLSTLLDAHRRARAEGTVPDLVLAGPAGWGPEAEQGAGVHVTGWLSQSELHGVVARARAVLLPSHYEGFGLPLLEAMAAGTAVVASDVPAHREVAGGHATLVAPTDVDGWAEALTTAAPSDGPRRAEAAAWARQHTWRACAEATVDAYRRAVG